jgi:hypothetical protein
MKDIKSELEISSNMVTEIVDLNKKSKSQMEDLMKLQVDSYEFITLRCL